MVSFDEKANGIDTVGHHDHVPDIDHVVHIANETEKKKISPWTWPMLRLYLALTVAYLCGYVSPYSNQLASIAAGCIQQVSLTPS